MDNQKSLNIVNLYKNHALDRFFKCFPSISEIFSAVFLLTEFNFPFILYLPDFRRQARLNLSYAITPNLYLRS